MAVQRAAVPYVSPEEYLAAERLAGYKSEYRAGQVYATSGASFRHNVIAANILTAFSALVRGSSCQAVGSDLRVQVRETGLYTYPDVTVVCGEPQFTDAAVDTLTNPLVVVEVLSPSTRDYDRGEKWQHYRRLPSLRAYLVVHPDRPLIEYHYRADEGT